MFIKAGVVLILSYYLRQSGDWHPHVMRRDRSRELYAKHVVLIVRNNIYYGILIIN